MLPTFTATPDLARFVSSQAQCLSDADRILSRHGFSIHAAHPEAAFDINRRILDLFDAAIAIHEMFEATEAKRQQLLAEGRTPWQADWQLGNS